MDQINKIKQDAMRLSLAVQRAVDANQIWRELGSVENHDTYSAQFGIYTPLFNTVRDLALCQLLNFISRAYDETKGTLNIIKLLKRMRKAGYSVSEIEGLTKEYIANEQLWGKLKILRNECMAHSSTTYSEKEAFKRADITNDEVSSSVEIARKIMVQLVQILNISNSRVSYGNWQVKHDCKKLLKNLKAGREARFINQSQNIVT